MLGNIAILRNVASGNCLTLNADNFAVATKQSSIWIIDGPGSVFTQYVSSHAFQVIRFPLNFRICLDYGNCLDVKGRRNEVLPVFGSEKQPLSTEASREWFFLPFNNTCTFQHM